MQNIYINSIIDNKKEIQHLQCIEKLQNSPPPSNDNFFLIFYLEKCCLRPLDLLLISIDFV